jgi:aminoglycoside phosphotransferase (APT) family kinase protein
MTGPISGPALATDALQRYLDDALGDAVPITVSPLTGGGSCEVFAVDRGQSRWVLRRAPRHASSATAHDVLREFRILDAIKEQPVRIAHPVVACDDPAVFGAPFYVMERIDGTPILQRVPDGWAAVPETHGRALEELIDALVAIHAVDWRACGLGDLAPKPGYIARQIVRWLDQLDSYGGRDLPAACAVGDWLEAQRPDDRPHALCHGDYKLDNVLFARDAPPHLLAVVDWEMAAIGDPLVDLAWAMIFHPGPDGTMRLGIAKEPRFAVEHLPGRAALVERYAARSGRDTSAIGWYDVFARWKLAIVLEGSYAKFQRGLSDKPVHEHFGAQADLLLASATALIAANGNTNNPNNDTSSRQGVTA